MSRRLPGAGTAPHGKGTQSTGRIPAPRGEGPETATVGAKRRGLESKEDVMKIWKRPRIREITCGMEINGYFPAEI